MKFEKEINFYNTPAIASKFSTQDTSLEAINGKISKIISDTQLTQYDNGQNTMASALNAAISTATSNAQTLSTLRTNFDDKSGAFDDFVANYNDQLATTTQNISTVGSVAASKGKIFSAQPSIPYQVNDIWLKNGQNGSEIYRCITAKTDTENDVFSASDWVKATSYATSSELNELSSTVSTIQQTADSISLKVQASNNTHKLSDIVNGENYDLGDFVVTQSGVKRVTTEPNRGANGNAIYRSTDLTDVTNEIPTSAEISTAIDNGISTATINADNIDFSGKTLNMKTRNFSIESDKLHIDNFGSVIATSFKSPSGFTNNGYQFNITLDNNGLHGETLTSFYDIGNYYSVYYHDSSDLPHNDAKYVGSEGYVYDDRHHDTVLRIASKETRYSTGLPACFAMLYDNGIDFRNTGVTESQMNIDHVFVRKRFECNDLYVWNSKHRLIKNTKYGDLVMSAYETPSPMFGDVGEGVIGEDGQAYIYLDPKFLETIRTDVTYQVFLQSYSENSVYVSERKPEYFVAKGIPGSEFAWEIKGRQGHLDFDYERLRENKIKKILPDSEKYVTMVNEYINDIRKERVTV